MISVRDTDREPGYSQNLPCKECNTFEDLSPSAAWVYDFLSSLSPLPDNKSALAVLRVNAKADFWQGKERTSTHRVIYGNDKVFLKVAHQENDSFNVDTNLF